MTIRRTSPTRAIGSRSDPSEPGPVDGCAGSAVVLGTRIPRVPSDRPAAVGDSSPLFISEENVTYEYAPALGASYPRSGRFPLRAVEGAA
jgi:hypothetical protein